MSIHYLDKPYISLESVDHKRNDYIRNAGFEIIRFSEEQIFLHPMDCILFIEAFIKSITSAKGKPDYSDEFVVKKWTKEQAYKLAYQRFRNTYIPSEIQRFIKNESYKTYAEARSDIENINYML